MSTAQGVSRLENITLENFSLSVMFPHRSFFTATASPRDPYSLAAGGLPTCISSSARPKIAHDFCRARATSELSHRRYLHPSGSRRRLVEVFNPRAIDRHEHPFYLADENRHHLLTIRNCIRAVQQRLQCHHRHPRTPLLRARQHH